jgi:AraC-like DNA-binding protein
MHFMPQEPLPGAPTTTDALPPPYLRYAVAGTRPSLTTCKEGHILTQQAEEAECLFTLHHFFLQTGGHFLVLPHAGFPSVLCILRGMLQTESGTAPVHTLTTGSYQWLPPAKEAVYPVFLPKGNHVFCTISIPQQHLTDWSTTPQRMPLAVKQLMRQLSQKQPRNSLATLLPLLTEQFRMHSAVVHAPAVQQAPVPNRLKVHRIKEYLLQHLTDSISIRQLSLLFTINEYQLKKDFRSVFGTSIHNFVIQQRIDSARELLLKGEQSIEDIACATGFYDRSHFSKKFKSATGQTPSGYLKSIQNENQYNKKTA